MNAGKPLVALIVSILLAASGLAAEALPTDRHISQGPATSRPAATHFIEISISRTRLTLYEKHGTGKMLPVAEYRVGSAMRGLKTYPLGLGRVTAIQFDPWWHPTAYSRQVFRERGISLPRAVPPGHHLNYMGPFKISLSHRTWKGAIYRIHGNNDPRRVGRRVTGGCFAMDNRDGLDLARRIRVGTQVNIVP